MERTRKGPAHTPALFIARAVLAFFAKFCVQSQQAHAVADNRTDFNLILWRLSHVPDQ